MNTKRGKFRRKLNMTEQKILSSVQQMKINQTLMKSNSCSWMLIENSSLELWLNFSTLNQKIYAFWCAKNNRGKVFHCRKFVNYIIPRFTVFVSACSWNWTQDLWDSGKGETLSDDFKSCEDKNAFQSRLDQFQCLRFNFPQIVLLVLCVNICFSFDSQSDIVC